MTDYFDLDLDDLPLPKNWPDFVKTSILDILVLIRIGMISMRECLISSGNAEAAKIQRLETEVAMLEEEIRINSERLSRISPRQRPQYRPLERMAILKLQAMRGWNMTETAERFGVTPQTISAWHQRADDDTLLVTNVPVNRFPDLVRYIVQQIKLYAPHLGRLKIAAKLARAGLHIAEKTVERITKEKPVPKPDDVQVQKTTTKINAKYPGHTVHADLTVVPVGGGFWTRWFPFALPQRWPYCHWVLNVVDHYSRSCLGSIAFKKEPSSEEITEAMILEFLKQNIRSKHLIVDRGPYFDCDHFKSWCNNLKIGLRFGAIGKHASIARVERYNKTMKELLGETLVEEEPVAFQLQLDAIKDWFNEHRPNEALNGCTPNEVFFSRPKANEQPRIEPRAAYPRGSPCASPQVDIDGEPGDEFIFEIDAFRGHRFLPVVRIRRAA